MGIQPQYFREFNKLLEGFDAWINLNVASFDYQLVLVDVWLKAFSLSMQDLVSLPKKDVPVENWQQFLQIWSSAFDRVFIETFRSEDVLERQGKFLNALMKLRLHQQQLIEMFLKMNNQPTRTEVDEIHHSIYELRKEIKVLKKTIAQSERL